MSCGNDCSTLQRNIPFTGGCWRHDDRKMVLVLIVCTIIATPLIMHYGSISNAEMQNNFRAIDVMGCTELRHYLASDPPRAETEKSELNFKWKCLEAGLIDMQIDSDDD